MVSLNLKDSFLRITGRQSRQTGGTCIGQVATYCTRGGGVRPILTSPDPARGKIFATSLLNTQLLLCLLVTLSIYVPVHVPIVTTLLYCVSRS